MLCLHVHLLCSVHYYLSYNRFEQPCSSNSVTRDLPWSSCTLDRQFSSMNSSQSFDLQYPWISTETYPILSHLHVMVSQDSQHQNSPFNILPITSTFLQVSLSFPQFSHFIWVQNHYHVDDTANSVSKEKLGVPPLTTMLLFTLVTDPEKILPKWVFWIVNASSYPSFCFQWLYIFRIWDIWLVGSFLADIFAQFWSIVLTRCEAFP